MDLIAWHWQLEIIYDKEKLKYKLKHAENNQLSNNRMTNVETNLGQIYQGEKNGNNVWCMNFQSQCSFREKVGRL